MSSAKRMNSSFRKLYPLVIISGSLLFFAAVFQWVVFPLQNKVIGKANTIEAEHVLQANQENRVKELPQLRTQYDFILKNEGVVDTLISHDQVVPFIENIESLAHDNAVEIVITSRESGVKKKPAAIAKKGTESNAGDDKGAAEKKNEKKDESIMGNLPLEKYMALRFDVRGKYADAVRFLHQVESLPYAVEVVALDIRHFEPDASAAAAKSLPAGSAFLSMGDTSGPVGKLPLEDLVQALFDIIVYTKD